MIPPSRTLSEYDNREFADEQIVFSTFTYLIDLTRITGALLGVLKLEKGTEDLEAAVANVDAMLVNWKWHLPKEKLGVIDKNEEIDELLFCAHNLHNLYYTFPFLPSLPLLISTVSSYIFTGRCPASFICPKRVRYQSHFLLHPSHLLRMKIGCIGSTRRKLLMQLRPYFICMRCLCPLCLIRR
jgi:hypothetical protein